MAGPVAELDGILQSMLTLKPPGVTQSKISNVTALCNANIKSEAVLIQRIYTHFRKAPSTHKLGVLYVVDSVTRGWVEQARKTGQAIGSHEQPADGTFAAGHKRVTELLPSFMNDIIGSAPEEQKTRISKLVDIWDRSGTFQSELLSSFRQKLAAPSTKGTTTPPGSPLKDFIPLNETSNTGSMPAPTQDTSSILQALANMAKSNVNPSGQPNPAIGGNMPTPFASGSVNPTSSMPPFESTVNAFGATSGNSNPYGAASSTPNFAQPFSQVNAHGNAPPPPPNPQNALPSPEQLQQQVQIIQMLQQQGIPQDQWGPVLQALMSASAGTPVAGGAPQQAQSQNFSQNDTSREINPFGMRSPPGRDPYNRRSRSRSPPGYDRRRDESPRRRRNSPTYGAFGDRSSRNAYRQRSPEHNDHLRRSDSPADRDRRLPAPGPKSVTWDNNIPRDNIKVLSRTLFVGGVTCNEQTLRGIFDPFGIVQTCIVNIDKRHAFVKMVCRKDAIAAKEGMERYRGQDMQLRTRWGVGFGPRDCSDYSSGISVIPIHKLTDADRKWMLTADYGGTGGKSIEGGMVVEEPDIEIGAGVSSKAISRRMATDRSGQHGPRSGREQEDDNRSRQDNRRDGRNNNQQDIPENISNNAGNNSDGNPNNMPFPFNFPGMPNGFQFPPGFPMFPGMMGGGSGQPPPPGAT